MVRFDAPSPLWPTGQINTAQVPVAAEGPPRGLPDPVVGVLSPKPRSEAETSESVGWQNFGKMLLVFGCIGSDFCKKILKICVLQHFSKSTRFSS